ncbi:IS3 family transposase [Streptomyces scabiei]|uniref:IS3 family transposase n=1 Tax=Streptomyces scabiei TaxID=1930 RepID=UPI00298FB1D6|nr:IS3 family transposase [Streptomyces scabiei]MDW8804251.1 IS3 family transposase [Streptomyces scabiei]
MRDTELKERIQEVHTSNHRVYGARKIWREPNRQGHAAALCTVERLMRELGIQGAVRGKRVITTIPGGQVQWAPDLVDRDFVAPAPNRCRVADFTHVKPGPRPSASRSSWTPSPAGSSAGPRPP